MEERQAEELLRKYIAGTCTPEEKRMLDEAFLHVPSLDVPDHSEEQYAQWKTAAWQQLQKRALAAKHPTRRLGRWIPYAAAVALLVVLSVTYLFLFRPVDTWQPIAASEVAPGTNRATLTLADGRTVTLDEAQEGIIINDDDIIYTDGSALGLSPSGGGSEGLSDGRGRLLAMTTPKGGTYQITLPDGSKVWLNAATTLKYPPRFDADQRRVEISGEAYFSVAKDSKRPFRVFSDGQEIEVLGTEFNVSAYLGEKETKTTLVEGSVRLSGTRDATLNSRASDRQLGATGASVSLVPGEQATLTKEGFNKTTVDLEPYIAWQKGDFHFSEEMESVMKQVGRWYDVEIEFRDESLKKVFVSGSVLRSRPLSELLTLLEDLTGAKFTVMKHNEDVSAGRTERRIVIMK